MDAILVSQGSISTKTVSRFIAWHRPDGYVVKLNIYGSSFENPGQSSYGRLICNNIGRWLANWVVR